MFTIMSSQKIYHSFSSMFAGFSAENLFHILGLSLTLFLICSIVDQTLASMLLQNCSYKNSVRTKSILIKRIKAASHSDIYFSILTLVVWVEWSWSPYQNVAVQKLVNSTHRVSKNKVVFFHNFWFYLYSNIIQCPQPRDP